jgi:hypothetical protein
MNDLFAARKKEYMILGMLSSKSIRGLLNNIRLILPDNPSDAVLDASWAVALYDAMTISGELHWRIPLCEIMFKDATKVRLVEIL